MATQSGSNFRGIEFLQVVKISVAEGDGIKENPHTIVDYYYLADNFNQETQWSLPLFINDPREEKANVNQTPNQ